MNNLKPIEIVFLVVALIIAIATFSYVFATSYLDDAEPISVSTFNFSSDAYDVSVINSASFDDFHEVYGIGEAKATAIVNYREALGGFSSVYQLTDLKAISDSQLEAILEYFYGEHEAAESEVERYSEPVNEDVSEQAVTSVTSDEEYQLPSAEKSNAKVCSEEVLPVEMIPVEINYADAETISASLLIDISVAEEIVDIREKIGGYSYAWELTLCKSMSDEIFEKISNFVIIS